MSDDATLLRRYILEGADDAFAELVRRHLGLVYSAAKRRLAGDAHGAADVAQVVFVRLARNAEKLARHSALEAWLFTATRHAALDHIRSERRRRKRETAAEAMSAAAGRAEQRREEVDWELVRPFLDETMDELAERDREAVLLRYFSQRPFAEIGALLGISEDAARMRVERALERLRGLLVHRGVTSGAGALGALLAGEAVGAVPTLGLFARVTSAALAPVGGGVVGTGGVAGLKGLMALPTVIGGLALLSVGVASFEGLQYRREADDVEMARTEVDGLRAAVGRMERDLARTEQTATRGGESVGSALSMAALSAPPPMAADREQNAALVAGREYLARHPALKQALVDWFTAKAQFKYEPLFRRLDLTASQVAAFSTLMGGNTYFGEVGPGGQFLQLETAAEPSPRERDEQLKLFLGEEGYRKYLDYERGTQAREWTAQIAGRLFFSDDPLSPAQAEMLAALLGQTSRTLRNQSPAYWEAVLTQSAAFLAPQQVRAVASIRTMLEVDAATDATRRAVVRPSNEPSR